MPLRSIHKIKFTIVIIFPCAVQLCVAHLYCYTALPASYRTAHILQNWDSVTKESSQWLITLASQAWNLEFAFPEPTSKPDIIVQALVILTEHLWGDGRETQENLHRLASQLVWLIQLQETLSQTGQEGKG